ncbi:MAG: phosphatase PAP2 family protein [Alphaproteobacteria bacterium]|nr:phosphatase PAP2 family protein [Alphaproteobacteria bacterium]
MRDAAFAFVQRWGQITVQRDGKMRHLEAGLLLLLVILLFVAGWLWDEESVSWFSDASDTFVAIFSLITRLGLSGYALIGSAVICVAAIFLRRRVTSSAAAASLSLYAGRAFFIFTCIALSGIFSQLLKHLFGRARPKLFDMVGAFHFDAFSFSARLASFPSGHTVTAFALALSLSLFLPRWRWPLLVVAALVGLSRIVLGQHYPSDVFAGALLGLGSVLLLRRAFGNRKIVFAFKNGTYQPRRAKRLWDLIKNMPLPR